MYWSVRDPFAGTTYVQLFVAGWAQPAIGAATKLTVPVAPEDGTLLEFEALTSLEAVIVPNVNPGGRTSFNESSDEAKPDAFVTTTV